MHSRGPLRPRPTSMWSLRFNGPRAAPATSAERFRLLGTACSRERDYIHGSSWRYRSAESRSRVADWSCELFSWRIHRGSLGTLHDDSGGVHEFSDSGGSIGWHRAGPGTRLAV